MVRGGKGVDCLLRCRESRAVLLRGVFAVLGVHLLGGLLKSWMCWRMRWRHRAGCWDSGLEQGRENQREGLYKQRY